MAGKNLKAGSVYKGPKAVFTDGKGVTAHYAIDDEGEIIARLIHVDLAPGDPDDGKEEYRIANEDDPVQAVVRDGKLVDLEVDAQGHASTEV